MAKPNKMLLAFGIGAPEKKEELVEFKAPEGLDVADIKEGEEKEVVAKVRKKGDNLCLVSLNGVEVSPDEYPEDEEEDEAQSADDDEFAVGSESVTPMDNSPGARAKAAGLM